MTSLLLPLLFLPIIITGCTIDWKECSKATCFSKYASQDRLALYAKTVPGQTDKPDPTVGLFLLRTLSPEKKVVTTVGIQVEASGMQDGDFAALVVGDKILAGCHKGSTKLEIAQSNIIKQDPAVERAYDNKKFCCKAKVENLNVEFLAVSRALPLAINYTTGNKATLLHTEFSAQMVLDSLEYREEVKCDISSFHVDNFTVAGTRPYYPLQDPTRARCDIAGYKLQTHNGTHYVQGTYIPVCENGKWVINNDQVDLSKYAPICEPLPKQQRRSCSGFAPPTEIMCGAECGTMDERYFICEEYHTYMRVLDENRKWHSVDRIVCTENGFVSLSKDESRLISPDAKVQCRIHDDAINSSTFFLESKKILAVFIGLVIYVVVFIGIVYGCNIVFNKWEERVRKIVPPIKQRSAAVSRQQTPEAEVTARKEMTTRDTTVSEKN